MSDTDASAELRTIAIGAAGEDELAAATEVDTKLAAELGTGAADCGIALWVALASPSMNASREANLTDLDIMKSTCAKAGVKAG